MLPVPVIDAYTAPFWYSVSLMFANSGKELKMGSSKSLMRLSFQVDTGSQIIASKLVSGTLGVISEKASLVEMAIPGFTTTIV